MAADLAGGASAPDLIAATDLCAGTRILYGGTPVTIVSGPEPGEDIFGRAMMVFQARREDTGKSGPMLFGPEGVAHLNPVAESAPETPTGT